MKLFSLTTLIFFSFTVSAQQLVTGKVLDPDGKPLPYANVILMTPIDSTWIDGTTTDDNGRFKINTKAERYLVEVSFLSFQKTVLGPFEFTKEPLVLNDIILESDNVTLDEVVVETEKSQVEFKLDKRVFNVGKDLDNLGGSASDILDNIPGITVDIEGGVSLRGSGNVRILINGQPSGLTTGDNNALRQLQASMIEKIEVITNPSARYEAEGEVGIINIILKKNRKKGVNGSVDVNTGFPHNHGVGLNLNYRRNKLNLFTNVGGQYRLSPGQGSAEQYFFNESDNLERGLLTDREHDRSSLSGNLQLGADYNFNPKTSLTVSGIYSYGDELNITDILYTDLNESGTITAVTSREDRETEIDHDSEGRLNFTRQFDSKEHKWTIDINYQLTDDTETSDFVELNEENEIIVEQRSQNEENEKMFIFQSDYVYPFSEDGKFETGIRASYREVENAYLVEQLGDNNEWNVYEDFNDAMIYAEGIYAGYLIFGNKIADFGFQLGLRAEYSDILTELKETDISNPRNYLDWFPSAHFSYDLNDENQIQLSYSRRISRPRFRHLLPFSTFSDIRRQRQGNPDLNPEYTSSIETGWLRYFESGSILTSIYYRYRTQLIQRIRQVEDDITISIPVNLGTQNAMGLEVGFNYDLAEWLQSTLNINAYHAITKGQFEGQNFDVTAFSLNSRMNLKAKFRYDWDIQTSLDYRAPEEQPQGRRLAVYSWNIGASKDILNKKGTISINVRDVLNSRFWRWETEGMDFYEEGDFQWRARSVVIGFNYQINPENNRKGRRGEYRDGNGTDIDMGG
ncbi:MAG: TonB-dependent receptor [Saprospiraceae bacterium]|nr:TonB-dependent receptor [Saprospiraceae bacterium]